MVLFPVCAFPGILVQEKGAVKEKNGQERGENRGKTGEMVRKGGRGGEKTSGRGIRTERIWAVRLQGSETLGCLPYDSSRYIFEVSFFTFVAD